MAKGEWHDINPPERSRTYVWLRHGVGGHFGAYAEMTRTFVNVTRVKVSESGTHYVETQDGKKAIVAPGWAYIDLDVDEWTF